MSKAQVSLEAIAAVIIIVIVFLLILVQNSFRLTQNDSLERFELQRADCTRLTSAITLVQSVPENAEIEIRIRGDANITNSYINFEDHYCEIRGAHNNATLTAGNVRVSQQNGVVSFENI